MTYETGNMRSAASPAVARRTPASGMPSGARVRDGVSDTAHDVPATMPRLSIQRVVERVIHTRNAGAYGYFEACGAVGDEPVGRYTRAGLFQQAGARTPLFARFSTVAHGGHGPETVRDPRGFCLRFQTDEGRWDLVGSNLPVSFVRDPTLFPSIAHAFRPEPLTHRLNPQRIFEFLQHTPSALHMVTWLFSPWGIPANYRSMCGFSAGIWINADDERTFVRYQLTPAGGVRNLAQAEADAIQGRDFNHATRDLHEAIGRGDVPTWHVAVQLIAEDALGTLDFDPLDPTITWSSDRFPPKAIGRVVLDRNPKNYFAEVEQVMFDRRAVVDGVADAEGGAAVAPIGDRDSRPLQRPACAHPSRVLGAAATGAASRPVADGNHLQAGECYRHFGFDERDELVRNLVDALRECDRDVQLRMAAHFLACDAEYGRRVADGLRLDH